MICTFYSHQLGFEKIVETLKSNIPKAKISFSEIDDFKVVEIKTKGGLFSSDAFLKVSYRERLQTDYQIHDTEDCPLNENLKGLYGFVSSLPTNNEKVKELLLRKVQTLNSEFSFIQEKGTTKNLKEIIRQLAKAFDPIIFAQPNTIISKSGNQHFLDTNLNLIIDPSGNCEIEDLNVSIDSKYYDAQLVELSEDQVSRKSKNETILEQHEVKINYNLPCIESESDTTIRTAKEISERLSVLTITNSVAFNNITGDKAIEILKHFNLWDKVTPKEIDFLEDPTDQKKSQETWKCEGIWTLMWALNIVDNLGFPNEMADLNNIPIENYPIGNDKDPNDFINAHKNIRTRAEILNANDLYYRLNWLINYMNSDWDDVTCDT